jgi:hypothetical protein
VSIHVGAGASLAQYRLRDPAGARRFLAALTTGHSADVRR